MPLDKTADPRKGKEGRERMLLNEASKSAQKAAVARKGGRSKSAERNASDARTFAYQANRRR